jgi:hypothetical protein
MDSQLELDPHLEMRAANRFVLDDDIVHRLLRLSFDFSMLQSFVLSCRAVHAVYKSHPKSINRAVAYNIVGPVLPQALQLIKNRSSDDRSAEESSHVPPVDATTIISQHEMDALEHDEDVVMRLEDMFSLRYIFQSTLHVVVLILRCQTQGSLVAHERALGCRVSALPPCHVQFLVISIRSSLRSSDRTWCQRR